jgi:probable HAF family extracellular repeat protein
MRAGAVVTTFGIFAIVAGASAEAQTRYRLTDLGTLGGTTSQSLAINASGQVTGWSYTAGTIGTSSDAPSHAFLWDGTAMRDLGTLGGWNSVGVAINSLGKVVGHADTGTAASIQAFLWDGAALQNLSAATGGTSYATAINNLGQIAGYAESAAIQGVIHATLWDGSTRTDLGTLGGTSSWAYAVNALGQVTGFSNTSGNLTQHAFLWDGTTMRDLGTLGGASSWAYAINSAGQVTGSSLYTVVLNGPLHAFLWNGTVMQDLGTLGGTSAYSMAINESGQTTGYSQIAGDTEWHALLWNGTIMQDLGTLGGSLSYGAAINAAGQVTGYSFTSGDQAQHAMLWDGTALHDLNALIDPADPLRSFVTLTDAAAINDSGQIAANGIDSRTGQVHGYLVSPVTATDTTPPEVHPTGTGPLGNSGWYVGNVTVSWTVTDSESAVSSSTGCGASTVTTDTVGVTFTCSATSAGGTATQSVTIKRDATPPTAKAMASPMPNRYGWNDEPVTVKFKGADGLSGGVVCDPAVVLSHEGTGLSASGRCYDAAGNASALATAGGIRIDRTAPVVTIGVPVDGATYNRNQVVVANYSCTDALSGLVACKGDVPTGKRIDTSRRTKNVRFTVVASDRAGNEAKKTVTYNVQ